MKKKTMSARISAARTLSPHRKNGSANRADEERSSSERASGAMRVPASIVLRARGDRAPVALQLARGLLRLGLQRGGQGSERQLLGDVLAGAEAVVDERLGPLGDRRARARLAHVLI